MIEQARKELQDVEAVLVQMDTALADAQAYGQAMERKLAAAGVKTPLPPPPPLNVYPTIKDIDWEAERMEDNDETRRRYNNIYVRWGMTGGKEVSWYPPTRNVIVEKHGELSNIEVRRGFGAQRDYELIINRRCLDVTDPMKPMLVQNGDDGFETDADDKEMLARNYQGGLNQPLSSWREDYQQYAQMVAQNRPDLVGEWEAKSFDLAPKPTRFR